MIKFEQITEGFKLYYNNYLFFEHTQKSPIIKVGEGIGRYKEYLGEFKIREKLKNEIPLTDFEIISKSENEVKLILKSNNTQLTLLMKVVNERLELNLECADTTINRFWIKIQADSNEAIYGCGEQYSELNLRGKEVPLWVEEQGVGRGSPPITGDWYTTYYPQPTFISSNNYYCHVEASSYSKFNFEKENSHELYIWTVPEKIIIGKYDTALEVVSNLSNYLGRQPELPDWAYDGVWLGIQGGNDIVDEKIAKCLEKGVKVSGVWCQDWQGILMHPTGKRLFWNWKYDSSIYPDLPSYIKKLKQKGIRFLGYINSHLNMDGDLYKEASKKGLCIKNKKGSDYSVKSDIGKSTLLDLSNPETIEWLKSVVKEHMINIGLAGWMADYGEYLPMDAVLHSGESPETFHNKYPMIWSKTMFEAVEESGKLGEIIFFTRSGYSRTSKYTTMMWAGDQLVNWSMDDGIASVIPAEISISLCGIGYIHSDLGGFHTFPDIRRDEEVFKRWTDLEVFSPVMRSHEGVNPVLNLQFDTNDDSLEHLAKMSKIYVDLKPYYKHISKEYREKGYPLIRACYLHYENDPELHKIKYQYLLGRDLLVAPVIKPNVDEWKVYFPDDSWIHVWSGKEYTKGWHTVKAPIGNPPVFYLKDTKFSDLFKKLQN